MMNDEAFRRQWRAYFSDRDDKDWARPEVGPAFAPAFTPEGRLWRDRHADDPDDRLEAFKDAIRERIDAWRAGLLK
jgi:hypothetical protein